MTSPDRPLGLFEGYGVELEYMIVERDTLDVKPIADLLLQAEAGGSITAEIDHADVSWSNELSLHVVEFKTSGPAPSLTPLAACFQAHIARARTHLRAHGATLLPGAVHPWMSPDREARLWPHEYNAVYETFNRIFDCRGHGWTNLQSAHLNLPFANDEEFGRLHAAIRLVLPLIPALAASSPVLDGRVTGLMDSRLEAYRHHCDRIPSLVGGVIPEPVFSPGEYQERILRGLYRDVAPYDPDGVIQHEWVNARGAIARFDRMAIEIRVVDVQECPAADLAVAAVVVAVLRALVEERWSAWDAQQAVESATLRSVLDGTIREADAAMVTDPSYLECYGITDGPVAAGALWARLAEACAEWSGDLAGHEDALGVILRRGPLARRLLSALASEPSPDELRAVYRRLEEALADGVPFLG